MKLYLAIVRRFYESSKKIIIKKRYVWWYYQLYWKKNQTKVELEKHFEGQAVGGYSRDVVNIGFSLDIGDISGSIDGDERQNIFLKLWGRFDFDNKEQKQFFLNQRKDMEYLLSSAKKMVYPYEYGRATLLILLVDFILFAIY